MTLDGAKVALAVAALVAIMTAQATSDEGSDNLAAPESFAAISDSAARSAALFMEAAKVLTHPRCVNCHPAGDRPRQGDIRRLHSRRSRAARTGLDCRRCAVRFVIKRPISNPPKCRAILAGIWRRAR